MPAPDLPPFARYVALGDSMSIDLYPALDLGETDVAVALERSADAGRVAPVGAASLLWRSDPDAWPDFAGRDLASLVPGIEYVNAAGDAATIGDIFDEQLASVAPDERPTLVTLTAGGNDLLSSLANRPGPKILRGIVRGIEEAYDFLVRQITSAFPNATLLLTTVYDPSDRSGRVPGLLEDAGPLPLEHLDALNRHIRALAGGMPGARVADVYAHFLGHGVSVDEKDRWYWRRSMMEPNARGASEIRRVWLEALGVP